MDYSQSQQKLLRKLPKVDELIQTLSDEAPRRVKVTACRDVLDSLRSYILSSQEPDPESVRYETIKKQIEMRLTSLLMPSLRPVVNATGVVIHTNLGRSLLPREIFHSMLDIAGRYSNLEYNLEKGVRGSRYSHVEELLCDLTGAESALVVNNNAAAVLITLETLARGKEVIVSRGELVEIGGSFRIPDVMAKSGAILREVGTTNRTHLRDYESAIGEQTALLLKVHQSNFQMVGFTMAASVSELAELGARHGVPVFEDLGSGNFIDFSRYGMMHEPMVQESLAAGADLVSFSGDKLLGGSQAGIIIGKKKFVDRIKDNPMNRAVRIDKLTLVALEGVLRLYQDPERAVKVIPTLNMLCLSRDKLKSRARRLQRRLRALKLTGISINTVETISRVGGGALPLQRLKSVAVALTPGNKAFSAAHIEAELRKNEPPVIVRIEEDQVLMDIRTLQEEDYGIITQAVAFAHSRLVSAQ
ncbi:MAG: L-seryl-tRNA(Sec) selenium transferase [Thermodesulfobacteriota bacterium]|nr:L-seryl-tRNA(Sec) selenium transferase [Thermodesulfobacteriota bacterium]